jgi:hypothetical protein
MHRPLSLAICALAASCSVTSPERAALGATSIAQDAAILLVVLLVTTGGHAVIVCGSSEIASPASPCRQEPLSYFCP